MEKFSKRATIAETADVANRTAAAITAANIDDPYLNNEKATLKQGAQSMVSNMGADKTNELTRPRDEADELRDDLLTSFIHFLQGFKLWRKPETQAAAKRLMRIIENHGGNFSRNSREKESALYDSLLLELQKPEVVADLASLNLTSLVADMTQAQSSYKGLDLQIANSANVKVNYISPSKVKREVQVQIDSIVEYLINISKAQPAVYGDLTVQVGQIVQTLNQKIRLRNQANPGGDNTATDN